MVAISLYRGNLHSAATDVPRRWPLNPTPNISLEHFRRLLSRRSSALSRLHHIINNNSNNNDDDDVYLPNNNTPPSVPDPEQKPDPPEATATDLLIPKEEEKEEEEEPVEETNGADEPKPMDGCDAGNIVGVSTDETPPETTNQVAEPSETENRKKEIEEKLQVLQAKKHGLVQALKQILKVEEELKNQNSSQGMGIRPSVPLQVDVTNDSGSPNRLITTPRLGSEGNLGCDIERGGADDTLNQNTLSRHLLRTTSVSPSSDSLHRRPAFSMVPHPRGSLGGVGSPSRFAPVVGHPPNIPAVSTSGASYVVSSPSPAASGGTSVFKENRLPSPWN